MLEGASLFVVIDLQQLLPEIVEIELLFCRT
jgi:hypothetical protein